MDTSFGDTEPQSAAVSQRMLEDLVEDSDLVECVVGDFTSIARGKLVDRQNFLAQRGCRLPSVLFGLTLTAGEPRGVFGSLLPDTYDDVRLVPDPSTARPRFGNAHHRTIICEPTGPLYSHRYGRSIDASAFSPRYALRRVLGGLRRANLVATVAPELEFSLLRRTNAGQIEAAIPFAASKAQELSSECYSLERAAQFSEYFEEMFACCASMGIPVTGYAHEAALSQYEVNFAPGEPLAQADAVFRFKRLAKEIAIRRGYLASFSAKPFLDQPGNGMHWHVSLQRTGGEAWPHLFAAPTGEDSTELFQFIAGLQTHAPASMPFYAPFDMSFDRIRLNDASPTHANWGHERRDLAFRIPDSSAVNRRIENRLPAGDSNPYLCLAVMLGAGLDGMGSPAPSANGDAAIALPGELSASLVALEQSGTLRRILGEPLVDCYLEIKLAEHAERGGCADPRTAWDLRYLVQMA